MPSNPQPDNSLESKIQAIREEAAIKMARQDKIFRKAHQLRECLERASQGIEGKPVQSIRKNQILIDNPTWAALIQDAGLAFSRSFDLQILVDSPLPDKGLGIEEGLRLLRLAAEGESLKTITSELETSRESLGPWEDIFPLPNIRSYDSELGIASFFSQLNRYCDGRQWSPPAVAFNKKKSITLTPVQNQMLELIAAGPPLLAKQLGARLSITSIPPNTIRTWIKKLFAAGYDIRSQGREGYEWLNKASFGY